MLVIPFWPLLSLVQFAQIASVSAVSNMGESVECQRFEFHQKD